MMADIAAPVGLLAELTHRCPVQCPYCSNPVSLEHAANELDTATWHRVFHEAAGLGVLQVHLSGGEPAARRDLVELTAAASRAGLYTNLITSGIGLNRTRLLGLREAGLDHVQLSLHDVHPDRADSIAGYDGAHRRKLELSRELASLGVALTINVVLHRANIGRTAELVRLAAELGAGRIELAHAQYHGWALHNHASLMPSLEQLQDWHRTLESVRARYATALTIDTVIPEALSVDARPGASSD
jgi:pyrroloquinoline quinone biosynthesis protein E